MRRILATLVVVMLAAGMAGLGVWQLRRLSERRAHNAEIVRRMAEAPVSLNNPISDLTGALRSLQSLDHHPVVVEGTFDPAQEIILRNRTNDEVPGVHLVTPLRLTGSESAVLVDRGWIPYDLAAPDQRAAFPPPKGLVKVEGLARLAQTRPSSLAPLDPPLAPGETRLDAWYRVDVERIQTQIPYPLLPVFIEEAPVPGDRELPFSGYDVDLSDGPHLSYAIQWFSFATTLLVGYTFWVLRQRKGNNLGTRR